ncbi:MAG: type II toxin-antitoxin system VapC family toxin [Methylococcaceae bacterium]|jgi:predicted nucleic acid-binding protein|nr:type II toxin-antitoxin system VapC family toxin [Methylococcaceae bacterium]MDZ4155418.1 type II toxin-antitoxin system VapC family toxin [Methylococcales bacterium]MDP2394280.1 type II toxin-antitoxin system VapC family toxin [Methylococcaceae bacterium]MDP3019375.1 type II toxin-antitoxin system VapC family toxin [Methylococcaceae bacterium]MDP3390629.1 type II toxin-antitoxin system VapC family toxin [Methylococcaceae bacterium]
MSRFVIDTSVAIKWFLPLKAEETHVSEALQILDQVLVGAIECYQPPHFIAEVIGVLTRLRPEQAAENLTDLLNMDFHRVETSKSYATACSLSIALNHHTFDTLFHAVALETPETIFITADEKYYRKAQSLGRIMLLQDYRE